MPDTEIRDLSSETTEIVACPAFIINDDGDAENCGMPLTVMITTTIRGDDYGSWPHYSAYFACGHSFEDMEVSLKYKDQI